MSRRCDRNRKRSKRRAIYCPIHQCYLQSVSRKFPLLALHQDDRSDPVQMITEAIASVKEEWLEAFWCEECQESRWYHVKHKNFGNNCTHQAPIYEVVSLPFEWEPQSIRHTYLHQQTLHPHTSHPQSFNSASLNQHLLRRNLPTKVVR